MSKFSIVTYGCQMNEHDSARMAELLRLAGHEEAISTEDADVIVINTCSVRDKAEQKLRSDIGRWACVKQHRPELLLVVAGCVAKQHGEDLIRRVHEVDLVIGPDNIPQLPALVQDLEQGGPRRACVEFDLEDPQFLEARPLPGRDVPPTAFVTVMKGCDEHCTYCIVPLTRGSERYRPKDQIITEIKGLVARGVREVTLLGQTVNSYRDPTQAIGGGDGCGAFAELLRSIAEQVPRLVRLRYMSPHPRHLTEELIEVHRTLPLLARHLHLPVQSGSDRILRRMLRRHDRADYLQRAQRLQRAVPGLSLSTDIIVGFPGETERDFEDTLQLVDSLRFVGVFGFKYSPRPGTAAFRLLDDIPETVKAERLERLFVHAERWRRQHLASLLGQTGQVLVEGRNRDQAFTGRTERNEIVHFPARGEPTGKLLKVKFEVAFNNSLAAVVIDPEHFAPLSELPRFSREAGPGSLPSPPTHLQVI